MSKNSLDLQDFLDASGDSAKRTRFLMIVLIVICVLAFAGYLNSIENSWMFSRIIAVRSPDNSYTENKLGYKPKDLDPQDLDPRYTNLHNAFTRNYVENALTMRVPFFGIAFDINDLGLLSGIGFIAVLGLLRFAIRNETISLRLSFKAAKRASKNNQEEEFEKFYDLLAMRLVFTMPHLEDDESDKKWVARISEILRSIPRLICFLPFLVYSLVAYNDYMTLHTGDSINPTRTNYLYYYTIFFWVVIPALASWCFWKLREIDKVWDENWEIIKSRKFASAATRNSEMAGGTEEPINNK